MSEEVDEYIEKQESPQKEICKKLRRLILKTYPDTREEIKMGVPWYEGRFYIVGLRDSVNLGFCVQGLSKEGIGQLKGRGKYMRHLKFRSMDEIDEKKVIRLLKLVKD